MGLSMARGVFCSGTVLSAIWACGSNDPLTETHPVAESKAALALPTQSNNGNGLGDRLIAELRERYHFNHRAQPQALGARKNPSGTLALLPAPSARYLSRTPSGISPMFLVPTATELALPLTADGLLSVRDKASGIQVQARLIGAQPVDAALSDGYALYPQASAGRGTVVHHPTEHGNEDFIEFKERPEKAEIAYSFRMSADIAGLRLVGHSLEFLDNTGAPNLRVSSPFLVDTEGKRVALALDVEGCAVDRDPRAPWGRPPVAPGATECMLRLTWDDSRVSYPILVDPAWVSTGSLSDARSGAIAERLPNGMVLVAGGLAVDQWSCLDSAELYNPATRTFAATGSLSTPRCSHAATTRANGQVIVIGGADSDWQPLASTELYDPATGTWSTGASLSTGRASHKAVLLNNGDVLVAGGSSSLAEKLSNASSMWTAAGNLPAQAFGHTLTALADGRALLIGTAQPLIYSPVGNLWRPAPQSLGNARSGHTVTRLNDGRLLLVGERSPTAELFNPSGETWNRIGVASASRHGHTATLLSDGRVLLVGGIDWDTPSDLSAEIYDPTWGTFIPGPGLNRPRRDHTAVLLPSGRVLVAGGLDAKYATTTDAEEFEPAALDTVITEYKLPAIVDPEILSDRMTELWASVTRPRSLTNGKRYPLLVFLHGNHGTCGYGTNPRHDWSCEYTDSGTCPSGLVPTPNHRGYDYMTRPLASRGYIVISINANRGINCAGGNMDDGGLNLARGRLILKHIEQLSAWNRGAAATPASVGLSLANRLDLTQVGLLGHSRGGEGARAAYQQYRDDGSPWPSRIVDPVTFRAIFEIGPVDGQTSRTLNAEGTRWNVLLPMCDGDVSDLEGVRPFDRMMSNYSSSNNGIISTYTVWGANHNYYNTEWQESDSSGCSGHRALFSTDASQIGSAEQRQTALRSVEEFFLANVGKAPLPSLDDLFNPERGIAFNTPIERGYGAGQATNMTRMLEDFIGHAGMGSYNVPNLHNRVTVTHGAISEHDQMLRAATIRWNAASTGTFFQTNFADHGSGIDLSKYQLLDFRIGRASDAMNVLPSTDLTVQLVNADDSLSTAVSSVNYGCIVGPVGGSWSTHQMLSTLRIPLADFAAASLQAIRGIRFTFSSTPSGVLYLANVRATRSTADADGVNARPAFSPGNCETATSSTGVPTAVAVTGSIATRAVTGNQLVSLRTASSGKAIEVSLAVSTPFPVRDDLLVLDIGSQQAIVAEHPQGNLSRVRFTIDKAAFDATSSGDRISVHYRRGGDISWGFGTLDKAVLDK